MDPKTPRWVDSHCHFMDDLMSEQEILEAFESLKEIEFGVYVGTEWADLPDVISKVAQYSNLYGALGIHPKHISDFTAECEAWIREQLTQNKKICALGEIGLDYFRQPVHPDPRAQRDVFERQLQMVMDIPKPVIIHARASIEDTLDILDHFSLKAPVVFHCFAGTQKEAETILERGFWLSFTGIITFPKNESLREIVRIVPEKQFMIETDCPFLAPVPYRGKTNRPSWVSYVGEKVAEIRGWSVEETKHITTENAYRFFQIPNPQ